MDSPVNAAALLKIKNSIYECTNYIESTSGG